MTLGPGSRLGDYELRAKLARGGYGTVYVAHDDKLDRDIAIKLLRDDYADRPQVVKRFLQEARSAAKIVHPGIVTVYECGHIEGTGTEADGSVFIAMELLDGETLQQRMDHATLDLPRVLEFAVQIAVALEAAHGKGIVHRDLKPDNLFVVGDTTLAGGERIKIVDFGIAKLADADADTTNVHTVSTMMLGTPRYMSPEQCRSSATVDHRSDIYSFGCILFHLLCGKSPYDGDAGEQIAKHQLAPTPRIRGLRPDLPRPLDQLVYDMLAKDPADRPQTMADITKALEGIDPALGNRARTVASDATVLDTPPETRAPRRWPALVAMAAAGALIAGAGVYLATGGGSAEPVAERVIAAPQLPAATDLAAEEHTCRKHIGARAWDALLACAEHYAHLVPAGDATARALLTTAIVEGRNAAATVLLTSALAKADIPEARKWLDRIDDDSLYKAEAVATYDVAQKPAVATTVKTTYTPACNASPLASRAREDMSAGSYRDALIQIEASLRCKTDPSLYRLAVLAACNSDNAAKARQFFAKLPAGQQQAMIPICLRNKIALP